MWVQQYLLMISSLGRKTRGGGIPEAHWPASVAELVSSRFSSVREFKKTEWTETEKDTWHWPLASTHMLTCEHAHTRMHTYTLTYTCSWWRLSAKVKQLYCLCPWEKGSIPHTETHKEASIWEKRNGRKKRSLEGSFGRVTVGGLNLRQA